MADLRDLLQRYVDDGTVPGAVALVARGEQVDVRAAGSLDAGHTTPMARDSIFRVASITKPITAAAVMVLVDDGRLAPDDRVEQWLPEIASPRVVREPSGPIDDVVPADRPITVDDLLTFRAGWGFPDDFSLPAIQPLFGELKQGPRSLGVPAPGAWMAALARIPLLRQPGEAWLYNTCSDILGVLIARVSGRSLPDFLAERVFAPLGMVDTGFAVPAGSLDRLVGEYQPDPDGGVMPAGAMAAAEWSTMPAFPSGAGGLVSTVDDWHAFGRMLLAGGDGLLSAASVRRMMTDHLTPAQRDESGLFLEGQGWGYGGSVDVATIDPWNIPGRYGWIGGSGTAAHVTPSTGTVAILLTQVATTGPTSPPIMREFWRYAAGV